MAWFALRPRSLADKLTMLTVYSRGIVLALACAAFVVNDIALMRSWKAQELRETAEMLAAASAEPLEHANPRALRDLLMFQNHREQIYSVHVFDNAGDLFAKFERDEAQGPPPTRPSFISSTAVESWTSVCPFEPPRKRSGQSTCGRQSAI